MKLFTISLLLALLVGCVNKEEKRYRYVCDSLNRLDFPQGCSIHYSFINMEMEL